MVMARDVHYAKDTDRRRLLDARLHDPFRILGVHADNGGQTFRVYLPGARDVYIDSIGAMHPTGAPGLFEWHGESGVLPIHPRIRWCDHDGREHTAYDPYTFRPGLAPTEIARFNRGCEHRAWRLLGAHRQTRDGIIGTRFGVWAPNAERVSVVGDFNAWDGRRHPLMVHGSSGVWELFVPGVEAGALYKFEIRNRDSGEILLKTDPFGRWFEIRPGTAARVAGASRFVWQDEAWMRARPDWQQAPMSIYEVHAGSWRRHTDGSFLDYREMADLLADYVLQQGFTHVELLPLTEHPFDGSWGYQTTGYFAPTSRFGDPDALRYLVDRLHRNRIGVILDWVPGHFPRDAHALARFDGSALYEHVDPRRGTHKDWGTLVFNFGRNEVRSFLLSSALYWLEEFHLDGLRVDAVASMLYLDYGREPGEWEPNIHGGNENLEAVAFLRELNELTHGQCPGSVTIAEESTAWPGVSRPAWLGGLGFSMKWNMGWMHDTLTYLHRDPVHRHFHHDELTFGLLYAHSENFVLPLSHDEVVHGKGSLLNKMPGDDWRRFANLRLLLAYQFTYPGKKLLFMGDEFAMPGEWDHDAALPWTVMQQASHAGIATLVRDLNLLYREQAALHACDFDGTGFDWIDCHDTEQSVISYLRRSETSFVAVVLNFTPIPRQSYRLGVPEPGAYIELLNTDSVHYGGSDVGNLGAVVATRMPWMGRPYSLSLSLPPSGALILAPAGRDTI